MNDDASVVEVEVEAEVEPDIEPPVGENASGEEILTYLLSTLQGGDREVSATAWQRMQNPDVLDRLVDWFLADTLPSRACLPPLCWCRGASHERVR